MYTQVYFHPVRRVYDLHLIDFLKAWLPDGTFPVDLERHLAMTDNDVLAAISVAARDAGNMGFDPAMRIQTRNHFRRLYSRTPEEAGRNPDVVEKVRGAFVAEFGKGSALGDEPEDTRKPPDFPVMTDDGAVVSSQTMSDVLNRMPVTTLGYVFVMPNLVEKGEEWLAARRGDLTAAAEEEEGKEP